MLCDYGRIYIFRSQKRQRIFNKLKITKFEIRVESVKRLRK